MPRALVIQLARLGDLIQSLPLITALHTQHSDQSLDLLCPFALAPLGALFPGISHVLPWNGEDWHTLALSQDGTIEHVLTQGHNTLLQYPSIPYSVAYNLNNHPRAIVAAHLMGEQVVGTGAHGPLSPKLTPWGQYLRLVATYRGKNRIHLADAFCGLCGLNPPRRLPLLRCPDPALPPNFRNFGEGAGVKVALVVGAGDRERRMPLKVWMDWITTFFNHGSNGQIILVGGAGEQEFTYSLLDQLPPLCLGQIWNACGRTSFPQLVSVLSRCQWIVGSDTGPLHLGVACGAKAMGFYFARARVHETGPYGEGHWAWQAEPNQEAQGKEQNGTCSIQPDQWPIDESVELLLTETCSSIPEQWSLWTNHRDHRGVYFTEFDRPVTAPEVREQVWQHLQRSENNDWNVVADLLKVSRETLKV